MSLSYVRYVADGTTDEFDVPFDFLNRTHVKVTIDGNTPVLPIRWAGESRIKIADRIAAGSIVELRRETPISSRLVDFQNGSVLTEEELDTALNQIFFLQQELRDRTKDTLNGGLLGLAENEAAIDAILNRVLSSEAALELSNSVNDIAVQGEALAAVALDQSILDQALATTSSALTASVATVDNRVTALRQDHTTLVGVVDALVGGDPGTGIATLIQDEANARISGDTALAETFSLLGSKSSDNLSFILNTSTTRVSPTESLAQRFSALSATDSSNAAAIVTERNARVAGDSALATDLSALTARVGTAESTIITDRQARISGDSALATDLSALTTRVGTAESTIVSDRQARINGDTALATDLSALTTRVGTAESTIVSDRQARINGDNALASSLSSLTTRVGTAESTIVSDRNARISGDSALASDLALIGARTGDGSAWQLNLSTVRVSPSETLATRLSALTAADGANAAAIATEQTARVNGDNALASSISTLTSQVNGNTATISTLQSAVNGVSARYGVSLNVNGYVTGFVQNNDGTSGNFAILADRFSVVHPNGTGSPILPFEVRDGSVFMKEAFIGTLNVARLTSGAMGANITQNGDWNVGTGRIIWDNGTFMKVAGVGFGSNNQFIEWFGPKMAINLCNEANAIQYLKTNGSAYFGGSLSAGVIRNAVRTTSEAADASVILGPFGTNGDPRVIIASYDFQYDGEHFTGSSGYGSTTATLVLERGLSGSWTQVASFNVTISASWTASPDGLTEPGIIAASGAGSTTFTDTMSVFGSIEYRLRLTSRPLPSFPASTGFTVQTLGITSTEE